MKKIPCFLLMVTAYAFLWGCTGKDSAVRVGNYDGEELYVCDYFKLKDDTLSVRLSDLVISLDVVKLDTAAMIGGRGGKGVICSDNYILLRPDWQSPYKLFDRKGKFLCDVGGYGRGPGEYMRLYDAQLDEKNGRIFLLPFQARTLLVYDLQGEYVNSVSLAGFLPMGKFKVVDDKISLLTIPFVKHARDSVMLIAYQQDMEGNLTDSISALPYAVKTEYADWVNFNRTSLSFHVYQWDGVQDSLYHYIPGKKRLTPKFTVNYGGVENIPLHEYHEFGDYFWFVTYKMVRMENGQFTNKLEKRVLVDKKNKRAGALKIENDLLGGNLMGWNFTDGYYTENLGPTQLKDRLENFIKKEGSGGEIRKRAEDLLSTIQEDDNNYIIIGKMK